MTSASGNTETDIKREVDIMRVEGWQSLLKTLDATALSDPHQL